MSFQNKEQDRRRGKWAAGLDPEAERAGEMDFFGLIMLWCEKKIL